MSVTLGPRLGLMLNAAAGDAHPNEFRAFLRGMDALSQISAKSQSVAAQPLSPANGDTYILPSGATGTAWGGKAAGTIAYFTTQQTITSGGTESTISGWDFFTPKRGYTANVEDEGDVTYKHDGSSWIIVSSGGGGQPSGDFGATIALGEPAAPSSGVTLFAAVSSRDVIPVLTATSPAGYVASASSAYSQTPPWYAFTGSAQNGWLTDGVPTGTLTIEMPAPVTAVSYSIRPWDSDNFPSRVPTVWTFKGSADGASWTALDTRSISSSAWTSGGYLTFLIASPGAYKYYRLDVSANGGNSYMGIHDLQIQCTIARLCYKSSDGTVVRL